MMTSFTGSRGRVDLHLHTDASDGLYPPGKVVELASRAGLKAAAITDHDTLEGVEEAREAGRQLKLEVVAGVEISADFSGKEVHILGYYPKGQGELSAVLKTMQDERYRRMMAMLERLNGMGIKVTREELRPETGRAAPGRLHLARLLVKKGYCADTDEAFAKYLERGKPGYIPRQMISARQALGLLHRCGAIPVLAHPGESGKIILRNLVRLGLRGVEVFHPEHNEALRDFYHRQAVDMGLIITGGSDFHGDLLCGSRHPGSITVPYRYLEQLKRASRHTIHA